MNEHSGTKLLNCLRGKQYRKKLFNKLAEEYDNKKVHVKFIESENTKSDPVHVLERLDEFNNEYDLGEEDNLYLVIDRERWTIKNLSSIAQQASQKNFIMALSNPNFELWLLLHEKDVSVKSANAKKKLFQNKKINKNRHYIDSKLINLWDAYNKSNYKFGPIMDKVPNPIVNAKKLDINKQERWPNHLGTRVYLPVEDIIK